MIYGIGHDVLEIERITELMDRGRAKKFMGRVLTAREQRLADSRGVKAAEFVAGRFAAKEAVVKALGSGIGRVVGFQDVEILPDGNGKPEVGLSGAAWDRLNLPPAGYTIHLTITHGRELASAFAVVERLDGI
ncbi:holo-ACP synthase [Paenibacillus donghaensis]|uniref:Holo-[acyl-carrier-protein] synthase n=1 Tax=Paenibacillus donghaensis TaxID=414771 RepID=A0A2Z2KP86_9BACL|nr:holo-ACP synthase [Paenibacillus donghaensis]ASA25530.1 holo-[acyl-carrier-protein] synthase [Paenibacillus donghaensis]